MVVRVGHIDEPAVRAYHHLAVLRIGRFGPHIATIGAGHVVAGQRAGQHLILRECEVIIHRHRQCIRRQAVDRDGEGRRRGIAVLVGDGVGEGFGQLLAVQQGGHCRVAVVERIAVRAVGVQRDGAVGAVERRAQRATGDTGHRRAHCLRTIGPDAVVGEGVAQHRGAASGDAAGIVGGRRHVVHDLDDQVAIGGLGRCAVVRHDQRDGVAGFGGTRLILLHLERVGVADVRADRCARGTRLVADAGDAQLPFAGVDDRRWTAWGECIQLRHREDLAADGHFGNTIRSRHSDGSCGGFRGVASRGKAFLVHGGLASGACIAIDRHDLGGTVGVAVDGDGQRAVGRQRTRISDGVIEHLVQGFGVIERVDIRVTVVQRVGIAAVGVDGQRAVLARHHGACACVVGHRRGGAPCGGGHDGRYRHIHQSVVWITVCRAIRLDVARDGRAGIFSDGIGVGRGQRGVVGGDDGDGAVLRGRQRRGAAGIAPRLHVVAIAQNHGVVALRLRRAREAIRRVVAGIRVLDGGQHGLHLGHGGGVGEGDDQRRAASATANCGNAVGAGCEAIDSQHVAGNAVGEGDGHAARAEDGGTQRRRGPQVDVGHGAAAKQLHRVDGRAAAGGGVLGHRGAGGRMGETGRVVARRHGGAQGDDVRPGAGGPHRQRAAAGKSLHRIRRAHLQAAGGRAVEVGRGGVEAHAGRRGQYQRIGVRHARRHVGPCGSVGGVLPAAACRRRVAHDGDAAKGRGRIAAAVDIGTARSLVIGHVGIAQCRAQSADRRARARAGVLLVFGRGQAAVGGRGPVIDIGHRGGQRHGIAAVAIARGAARIGA